MSWWNKKAPEGETEEQRKIREEKEKQELLSDIGLAMEAKMKPLSDRVTSMDDRWKKLEEAAYESPQDTDPNASDDDKRKLRDEAEKRVLFSQGIANNARWIEQEALDTLGEEYRDLIPKIKERFLATPVERKAQKDYGQYCLNVINLTIGEAARAGGLRYDGASKRFFLEDANAGSSGEQHEFLGADVTWVDPKSGKTLTGRQQLEKLGITPEDFAKSVKAGIV
jgi:hypothetical protein